MKGQFFALRSAPFDDVAFRLRPRPELQRASTPFFDVEELDRSIDVVLRRRIGIRRHVIRLSIPNDRDSLTKIGAAFAASTLGIEFVPDGSLFTP